jgi:hypothetical protein
LLLATEGLASADFDGLILIQGIPVIPGKYIA